MVAAAQARRRASRMNSPTTPSSPEALDAAQRQRDSALALPFTVHEGPSPAGALDADARRTASGRLRMLLVLLVCAAPVVASYLTYYVLRPEGRRNFGELIDPQRPMPELRAQDLDGRPVALSTLKGQWLLINADGGACAADCEQRLYLQRQLRETLGRDKARLDRVWLIPDDAPVSAALRPALQGATVLRVARDGLAQWLAPAAGQTLADHLYVADPQGNWMLRFPARLDNAGAAKAKRDLERLMRASAAWDQEGRP